MAKRPDVSRLELLQGTLDMLILRTLQWGPQHGHGIGQAIRAQSDGLLKVETGSLYPALHEAVQRGIQGARLDLEQVVGLHADGLADAVAVLRAPLKRAKDEHVEGPLEEFQALFVGLFGHSRRQSTALDVDTLRLVPTARECQNGVTAELRKSHCRVTAYTPQSGGLHGEKLSIKAASGLSPPRLT